MIISTLECFSRRLTSVDTTVGYDRLLRNVNQNWTNTVGVAKASDWRSWLVSL